MVAVLVGVIVGSTATVGGGSSVEAADVFSAGIVTSTGREVLVAKTCATSVGGAVGVSDGVDVGDAVSVNDGVIVGVLVSVGRGVGVNVLDGVTVAVGDGIAVVSVDKTAAAVAS
jgi:hypothetical protein